MVPVEEFESPRDYSQLLLRQSCLPISPYRQNYWCARWDLNSHILLIGYKVLSLARLPSYATSALKFGGSGENRTLKDISIRQILSLLRKPFRHTTLWLKFGAGERIWTSKLVWMSAATSTLSVCQISPRLQKWEVLVGHFCNTTNIYPTYF